MLNAELVKKLERVVHEHEQHAGALLQLEREVADLGKKVPSRFGTRMYETSGAPEDPRSTRRVFSCDDQARAFGLLMMSRLISDPKMRDWASDQLGRGYGSVTRDLTLDNDGSALVPHEFYNRVKVIFEKYSAFERNAFRQPMSSDSGSFPKQVTDPDVVLGNEATAPSSGNMTFSMVTLNAKEWLTLVYATRNVSEDSLPEVAEIIAMAIGRAFANKVDAIAFAGDGTATYFGGVGIPQRLINVNGVDNGGQGNRT